MIIRKKYHNILLMSYSLVFKFSLLVCLNSADMHFQIRKPRKSQWLFRGFLILHSLKYNQFFQFLKPQLSIFFDYLINDRSFISALLPPPPFFPFLLCANHRWMLNITPQHKINKPGRFPSNILFWEPALFS